MVNQKETVQNETDQKQATMGIVFKLEGVAFHGRRMMYEAIQQVLKEKKIELSPILFSRYCSQHPLDQGLAMLLKAVGKQKMSSEKLVAAANERFSHSLTDQSLELDKNVENLISEAEKENTVVGAVSALPEECASKLMSRFGLSEFVKLELFENTSHIFPTKNCWLHLAKTLGASPHQCVALVTSALSCQSALAAGMRCAVMPDEFTAFQDFGGADLVIEDNEKFDVKKLMALLHTCSFR